MEILRREEKRSSNVISFVLPVMLLFSLLLWILIQSKGLNGEMWQSLSTVFVSILLEALPFLLLGIILSSIIHIWVSPEWLARLTNHFSLGTLIILGSLGGIVLPICECGIIPIIRKLVQKGLPVPVAITFMLAAPVLNPIVYSSTMIAFPSQPDMPLARMVVALVVVLTVGMLIALMSPKRRAEGETSVSQLGQHADHAKVNKEPLRVRLSHALHHMGLEFRETSFFLVFGAFITALFQVSEAREWLLHWISLHPWADHAIFIGLAYVLSLCSTSDAFVASSFANTFRPEALLSFLVFGPMLDMKMTVMMMTMFRLRFILLLTILLCILIPLAATILWPLLS
ncbi:permease [Paenibacillus sp. 1001270B_150601_E10]|uniref:permease n=1 Tax=Paenibacillus sp. 1001270B_150601_E10 TaxID=2787079 RepID=UPI00189EC20B|nr:permease [Paenibacillus sp. 1001270B_150601_E10]